MDLQERTRRFPTSTRFFLKHSLACGRRARARGERRVVPAALRPFADAWIEGYDAEPEEVPGIEAAVAPDPAPAPVAPAERIPEAPAEAAPARRTHAARKPKAAAPETADLFGTPPPTPPTARPTPTRRRKAVGPGA